MPPGPRRLVYGFESLGLASHQTAGSDRSVFRQEWAADDHSAESCAATLDSVDGIWK